MSDMNAVPVLDISPFIRRDAYSEADRIDTSKQWDEAFQTVGMAIIIGHEITEEMFQSLLEESSAFFNQSLNGKMNNNYGQYGNDYGGYTPSGGESVALSMEDSDTATTLNQQTVDQEVKTKDLEPTIKTSKIKFDAVESYVLIPHTLQERSHEHFVVAKQYLQHMQRLLDTLHTISSTALGISTDTSTDVFRPMYYEGTRDSKGTGAAGYALKLSHYPAVQTIAEIEQFSDISLPANASVSIAGTKENKEFLRYGAHNDYEGYTILRADMRDWWTREIQEETCHSGKPSIHPSSPWIPSTDSGGLEVFHPQTQQWMPVRVPAQHAKTALIVNAGDLFRRWTNDHWVSPVHGVSAPCLHSHSTTQDRTSIVFFSGPMRDVMIDVLPGALSELNRRQQQKQRSFSTTTTAAPITYSTDTGADSNNYQSRQQTSQLVEGQSIEAFAPITAKYEPIKCLDHFLSKISLTSHDITTANDDNNTSNHTAHKNDSKRHETD